MHPCKCICTHVSAYMRSINGARSEAPIQKCQCCHGVAFCLQPVTLDDAGSFSCEATNKFGAVGGTSQLIVRRKTTPLTHVIS